MPVPVVEQPKHIKFVRIIKTLEHDCPENLTEGKLYVVINEYPLEIYNDNGERWQLGYDDRGKIAPLIGV